MTHISPRLAVSDGNAAIKFYQAAFGAKFFLVHEAPDSGTRSPSSAGFTTVRIELLVDDPIAIHKRAVAAGAIEGTQSLSMSIKQLARQQCNECFKAPWLTRSASSGLSESSSTNNRARIPPPHVLQISSPTRTLASYG